MEHVALILYIASPLCACCSTPSTELQQRSSADADASLGESQMASALELSSPNVPFRHALAVTTYDLKTLHENCEMSCHLLID